MKIEYEKLNNKCYNDIYYIRQQNQINLNNLYNLFNHWKKAAIKLNFLLKECIRLGGMNNDNLNPILDLVQDVEIPQITEFDKQHAGIPSALDI